MGRNLTYSEDEALAGCDELAAIGVKVSAISLRQVLGGGGSLTTMQQFVEKWREMRSVGQDQVVAEIPDVVNAAFRSMWGLALREANRSFQRFMEQCNSSVEDFRKETEACSAYAVSLERENERLNDDVQGLQETNANLRGQLEGMVGEIERCGTRLREQEALFNPVREELASVKERLALLTTKQNPPKRPATKKPSHKASPQSANQGEH